ncbi:hypothetical protein ACJIZ3_008468 [Penstemon smallii]|uniref:Uncharacterized protein n=1 Tax=Penstemon smallii TaxID=265156 RepID=A0ABD3T9U5_9LAMI
MANGVLDVDRHWRKDFVVAAKEKEFRQQNTSRKNFSIGISDINDAVHRPFKYFSSIKPSTFSTCLLRFELSLRKFFVSSFIKPLAPLPMVKLSLHFHQSIEIVLEILDSVNLSLIIGIAIIFRTSNRQKGSCNCRNFFEDLCSFCPMRPLLDPSTVVSGVSSGKNAQNKVDFIQLISLQSFFSNPSSGNFSFNMDTNLLASPRNNAINDAFTVVLPLDLPGTGCKNTLKKKSLSTLSAIYCH